MSKGYLLSCLLQGRIGHFAQTISGVFDHHIEGWHQQQGQKRRRSKATDDDQS